MLSSGSVRISYFPECDWNCEHQGPCCAPSPAPCDRLPCDERCSELLSCGHRCPGLCGEPCPYDHFCIHPDCATKTPAGVAEQVVDLVSLTPFSSLSDAAVDADPLVALPCGHAYTASTLDAWLDMETRFYHRDQDEVKGCPDCREPIRGVRRYRRATHKAALDLIDRMMATAAAVRLEQGGERLQAIEGQLGGWRLEPTGIEQGCPTLSPSTKPLVTALQRAETEAGAYTQLAKLLRRGPKRQVYEEAFFCARNLVAAEEVRGGGDSAGPDAAAAEESRGHGRPRASAAQVPAAGLLLDRLGLPVPLTAEKGPSARSRLEAAEAALAALPPADARAVWEAQCAHLDAAALVNRIASTGLQATLPPYPDNGRTSTLLRSQATRFRSKLNARAERWSEPALSQAGAMALGSPGRLEPRMADRLTGAFLSLILARVAQLEASVPYMKSRAAVHDVRQRQGDLLDRGGMLLEARSAAWHAPAGGDEASKGTQNGGGVVDRAAGRMALQLSRVAFLQAGKPFQTQAGLGDNKAIRRQQEELLDEVQALAAEAEAALNPAGTQPAAAPGADEGPLSGIRRTAAQAAQWREQLKRSGELRDIVEAMARGEIHSGHRISYNTRILAGHLYRCANGHVYMVGECGSPEADATCPECGAPIGYGSRNARVQLTDAVLG
ncbi:hypothetical protein HYH03_005770 [Edaphochlamys debaryana]|uniref:RZ-type domain-containing protein n=1 Tax=Edaphochlamys debaryana TaxID=47281 RepID=A0A835Y4W5_9CHLO|nr:hypothetical protein HYH03_005770 [Edaphochlamys debaryana]|eukprot:KAG2496170.1 hypothetical protein HYH03_005770 [Edaphochlamys debaryana]